MSHPKNGFTLIETLVYIMLYAITVTGVVLAVYSLLESDARNQAIAMVEEEGAYVLGKIDWALSGASSVIIPAVSSSASQLTLVRFSGKSVLFTTAGGVLFMQDGEGTNAVEQLNNANTQISALVFMHSSAAQNGLTPESVDVSFTITATTSQGQAFSRRFSMTKYLRK